MRILYPRKGECEHSIVPFHSATVIVPLFIEEPQDLLANMDALADALHELRVQRDDDVGAQYILAVDLGLYNAVESYYLSFERPVHHSWLCKAFA